MTFDEYIYYAQGIAEKPVNAQVAPYNNLMYLDYTKLNLSRTKRWLKTGKLSPELVNAVKAITEPQNWIVITEPWCGDAAHIVPFIEMISRENPLVAVSYELRDSEPFRINDYLTNGTKSIPKLIVRNSNGEDLATWGPRPAECQVLYNELTEKKAPFEEVKTVLQNWYNADKGVKIQAELLQLFAA